MNSKGKQVAVVVGATSKWQSNGRNTLLAQGRILDDSGLPVGARWGVGGAMFALANLYQVRRQLLPCRG
jgi:hypothetical protein